MRVDQWSIQCHRRDRAIWTIDAYRSMSLNRSLEGSPVGHLCITLTGEGRLDVSGQLGG